MRRLQFDRFRSKLAPGQDPLDSSGVIETYGDKVPNELTTLWQEDGLAPYGGGLLTFVDPDDYADIQRLFIPEATDHIVFARTAFGDLFATREDEVWCTMIHHISQVRVSGRIDMFGFLTLCDDVYIQDGLQKPLFDYARDRLGQLTYDECYGYTPAPVLGGSESPDTLKRVGALIYLDIVAQASSV